MVNLTPDFANIDGISNNSSFWQIRGTLLKLQKSIESWGRSGFDVGAEAPGAFRGA
jgi:hypothetical protein